MAIVFESADRNLSPRPRVGDVVQPRAGIFTAMPLALVVEDVDENGTVLVAFLGAPIVLGRLQYSVVTK